MRKKILISLLIAAMLTSSLVGCGNGSSTETQGTTSGDTTTTETKKETTAEESRNAIDDGLGSVDFGGSDFIVLGAAASTNPNAYFRGFVVADDLTGEIVNDAVYNRNLTINERFNTTIGFEAPGSSYEDTCALIRKSVTAGESDAFHLISFHVVSNGSLVTQGYYMNWYDIPHIDFSKPWWSDSTVEDLTENGKCFLAVGDAAVSSVSQTYCMIFNKDKLADYDVPNVYDTVREGKWTLDYIQQIADGMARDLNGDGVMDDNDFYGFSSNNASNLDAYLWAFDNMIFQRNGEGNLEFTYYNEKLVNIVEKLYHVFVEDAYVYCPSTSKDAAVHVHNVPMEHFKKGGSVFVNALLSQTLTYLSDFDDSYGILPYPKFDEDQAEYKTMVDGNHEAMAIGKNAIDLEYIGTITEALCAESYKQVLPAYYDVCLKSRYADEPDDAEMIQLCVDSRVFDMGYVYDGWSGVSFILEQMIANQSKDIASYYASKEKAATKHYEEVLEMFYQD